MKIIRALIPLCVLLLPVTLRADPFVGKLTVRFTDSNQSNKDKGPHVMTYSMKEGFVRLDMDAKGFGGMIMNLKEKQMIILMPQQKMYMVNVFTPTADQQAKAQARAQEANVQIKDTGEKETILGYSCEKFIVTDAKGLTTELWLAHDLQGFTGMNPGAGLGRHPQVPAAWEDLAKNGGFPMRVVSSDSKGEKFRMEVTSVDPQSLADSVFEVPAGWQKFDMAAMFGAAAKGMIPGGSGGSN